MASKESEECAKDEIVCKSGGIGDKISIGCCPLLLAVVVIGIFIEYFGGSAMALIAVLWISVLFILSTIGFVAASGLVIYIGLESYFATRSTGRGVLTIAAMILLIVGIWVGAAIIYRVLWGFLGGAWASIFPA
jgi:hypothetical protein